MGKTIRFFAFLLFPLLSFGQQVKVDGYFLQDSARLGERVGYVLKVTHPEATQMIFPDSAYDFSPLILLEKKTFISNTKEGITQDSSIYYLSNFSLESSSFLSLPVYELARYDSITHFPLEAELKLKLMLDSIPEQPVFRENNVYQPLEKSINWIMAAILAGGVLLLLGVIYLLFAKRIRKIWSERSERRKWKQFEKKWVGLVDELTQHPTIDAADGLIGLWKGYMENLTGLPTREWTSSEIGEKLNDPGIFRALRSVDMIIYAGSSSKTEESTVYLYQVAKEKYQQKLTKIKHERAVV